MACCSLTSSCIRRSRSCTTGCCPVLTTVVVWCPGPMQRHCHRLSLSYRAHRLVPSSKLWAHPSSHASEQGNDLLRPCVERVRSLLSRRRSDGVSSVRPREEYFRVCLPMSNSAHEAEDDDGHREGLLDLTLEGLFPANQTLMVNPAKRTVILLSHTPGASLRSSHSTSFPPMAYASWCH
jgi:hypothetical protein